MQSADLIPSTTLDALKPRLQEVFPSAEQKRVYGNATHNVRSCAELFWACQIEPVEKGHKTPPPEPSGPPACRPGIKTRDRYPKDPNDPEKAETPGPTPIDPRDPTPNPSPDPVPKQGSQVPPKQGGTSTSTKPKARNEHSALRTPRMELPKPSNPDPQPRHPVRRAKKPPTPNERNQPDAHSRHLERGPTPKKRADQPAHRNKNMLRPKRPNTSEPMTQNQQSAQSPRSPRPPSLARTTATTRPVE
ncbi:hypothetical protein CRENBAI_025840 [Crenichthys baileyi]|uniref:Uncharacterized protein n=1 Tax=Crenichthys baileyi TaxID=28760 RepID=A0AAV9QZM6_9TELE